MMSRCILYKCIVPDVQIFVPHIFRTPVTGIGPGIMEDELVGIASGPQFKFEVSDFNSLVRIQNSIVNAASGECRTSK